MVKSSFRLNQALSKAGLCSRREADALIASGRVRVNGQVTRDFNARVIPDQDKLELDGKTVRARQFSYVALYKPAGVVTSCRDEYQRKGVLDLLPPELSHLRPVGRLDKESEGLLLLTNDGQLTQKLTHPIHHVEKVYLVTVNGLIASGDLKQLSRGITLGDGPTLPAATRLLQAGHADSLFELTIREGRNRQIRRMCAQLGFSVLRLVRISVGGLQLGRMKPGAWRHLSRREIRQLGS